MANRYWVGGSGTWNTTSTTNWSASSGGSGGASVPTAADSVFFDQAGTYTVTCTGNLKCLNITVSAGTVTFANGTSPTFTISGSMTLIAGTVWSSNGDITFNATTTGKTVTTNGVVLSAEYIYFNGVGGGWTLGSALTTDPNAFRTEIHFTNGTFSTSVNNYSITTKTIIVDGGTLSLNASTITVTFGSGQSFYYYYSGTVNAGTSQINNYGYFIGGGKTYYNVTHYGSVITDTNTFNNLTIVNGSIISGTQTINGTLTLPSNGSYSSRSSVGAYPPGSCGFVVANFAAGAAYCDFYGVTVTGAAAPISGTSFGDCGGNSGITFPAAKTVYWNLAGTQNWSSVGWATTPTGTPAAANFPLAQDTAVFTNSGSAGTITINTDHNIGSVDMSGRTNAMTIGLTRYPAIFGNWSTGTGVTFSYTGGNFRFFTRNTTRTITSNGVAFPFPIVILGSGGSVKLQDNMTANSLSLGNKIDLNGKTLTLSSGSGGFTTDTGYGGTTTNITFNGGTLSIAASGTAFNNSNPPNFTTTAGTGTGKITLTSASAKTFVGGGSTFNCVLDQGGSGALTITGSNSFSDITNSYKNTGATTITFTASTTTTVSNFTATGSAGNLLTINSSSAGTRATLSKASGIVTGRYLNIKDSAATGGAIWTAGGSINSGNNTGWRFVATGNFMFLFL